MIIITKLNTFLRDICLMICNFVPSVNLTFCRFQRRSHYRSLLLLLLTTIEILYLCYTWCITERSILAKSVEDESAPYLRAVSGQYLAALLSSVASIIKRAYIAS